MNIDAEIAKIDTLHRDGTLPHDVFTKSRAALLTDTWCSRKPSQSGITAIAFVNDSQNLLCAHANGLIANWDVLKKTDLRVFRGHNGRVTGSVYCHDVNRFVSSGDDGTIRVWDVVTGRQRLILGRALFGMIRTLKSPILNVSASNDACCAVTGGADGFVRVWDLARARETLRFEGDLGTAGVSVICAAFSGDQQRVLSCGCDDKTVRVSDATTGREIRKFCTSRHRIAAAATSPDGRYVLIAAGGYNNMQGIDCELALWDADSATKVRTFPGHTEPSTGVVFASDGKRVASVSQCDRTIRVWDVDSAKELYCFWSNLLPDSSLAMSRDGSALAFGANGTVIHWQSL